MTAHDSRHKRQLLKGVQKSFYLFLEWMGRGAPAAGPPRAPHPLQRSCLEKRCVRDGAGVQCQSNRDRETQSSSPTVRPTRHNGLPTATTDSDATCAARCRVAPPTISELSGELIGQYDENSPGRDCRGCGALSESWTTFELKLRPITS